MEQLVATVTTDQETHPTKQVAPPRSVDAAPGKDPAPACSQHLAPREGTPGAGEARKVKEEKTPQLETQEEKGFQERGVDLLTTVKRPPHHLDGGDDAQNGAALSKSSGM